MLRLVHPGHSLPSCLPGTLLAHVQLAIDQNPQILLRRAALQHLVPQSICTARVAVSQVENPALVQAVDELFLKCY